MTTKAYKIIYTKTDEAPMLATYSFLPIINAFSKAAGVVVGIAGYFAGRAHSRRVSRLPDTASRSRQDALAELGELAKTPEANIIKLPNISASLPQLQAAIKELQSQGYSFLTTLKTRKTTKKRISRTATTKSRERRQPGAARRQLGSPCAALRESPYQKASA